jgi:hypothetical protein
MCGPTMGAGVATARGLGPGRSVRDIHVLVPRIAGPRGLPLLRAAGDGERQHHHPHCRSERQPLATPPDVLRRATLPPRVNGVSVFLDETAREVSERQVLPAETRASRDRAATDTPQEAGIGSAVAIKLCATPRHGSTKRLRKNKRDGSEAIQSTPGSVKRSDKQRRWVRKLHGALMKRRPNGTLALLHSDKRTMMPKERTMR